MVAILPANLRRYFSTPVRYVPVAKVNPQIGMESSYHRGGRENLHTARSSIFAEKTCRIQSATFDAATGTKQTAIEIRKKTKDSRSTDLIQ